MNLFLYFIENGINKVYA